MAGSTLSPDEQAMLAQMDPKDRARYLLEKRLQEKATSDALSPQEQESRHAEAMQVINSIC